VHQGEAAGRFAVRLSEQLRDHGFSVVLHCGGGKFKNQMKKADTSGATVAVVIGDEEAQSEEASFKLLREGGEQRRVPAAQLGETLAALLYNVEEEDGSV